VGNSASIRVIPKRFKIGVHKMTARVTFKNGSGTKPKTFTVSFQRCLNLAQPQFTG
jgi:hypothetical protein